MAKVGYARVSTTGQSLDTQLDLLQQAGCSKIFREKVSAKTADRPELKRMLEYVREDSGDVVIVTKIDRLARSTADLLTVVEGLNSKGVGFKALNTDIDTTTSTGKLILSILGSVAQFERELMLERQAEGIAKAKAAGKYTGRKPTARAKADRVHELDQQGLTRKAIADQLEIGIASVYRILKTGQGNPRA